MRLILQRGNPDNEHNECAHERQELVILVQETPIQQLIEGNQKKIAYCREYDASREPTRREFVSTLECVADSDHDPHKAGSSVDRPWHGRRCLQISKQHPGHDHPTQDSLGGVTTLMPLSGMTSRRIDR